MNQFINQPVVNWARQNLPQTVEVKLKVRFKILFGVCFALLVLGFFDIPLLFYLSAISTFLSEGWNLKVFSGLFGGTIFLAIFGAFALGIFFMMRFIRRRFVRVLDAEGVETRGGQRFGWQDLYFLNYTKGSTRLADRLAASNLTFYFQNAVLYAGVKKIRVEMVFANGKAFISHYIQNQPQILALLNSMPAQQRVEGKIIQ